jgi:hypothetical protein
VPRAGDKFFLFARSLKSAATVQVNELNNSLTSAQGGPLVVRSQTAQTHSTL